MNSSPLFHFPRFWGPLDERIDSRDSNAVGAADHSVLFVIFLGSSAFPELFPELGISWPVIGFGLSLLESFVIVSS